MSPRRLLDAAVNGTLDAACRLDELADELEQARGRVTLVGRTLKLAAAVTTAAAIPMAIIEVAIGGSIFNQALNGAPLPAGDSQGGKAQG